MVEDIKKDLIQCWIPILKEFSGEYVAILSDTSLDRDNELMGKEVLDEFASGDYLPGLINHDNKVENLVCEWINRKVVEKNGHYALVSNPRFYKSNPKAVMVMDMLEKDGARLGVSISAMPLSHEMVEINGKSYKKFTKVEKIEASFIPIQSNRSAVAMAIAKSFDINIPDESVGVKKEIIEKGNDEIMEEKEILALKESNTVLLKELQSIKDALAKKELAEKELVEKQAAEADAKKKAEDAKKGVPAVKKELDVNADNVEKQWSLADAISKAYGVKR